MSVDPADAHGVVTLTVPGLVQVKERSDHTDRVLEQMMKICEHNEQLLVQINTAVCHHDQLLNEIKKISEHHDHVLDEQRKLVHHTDEVLQQVTTTSARIDQSLDELKHSIIPEVCKDILANQAFQERCKTQRVAEKEPTWSPRTMVGGCEIPSSSSVYSANSRADDCDMHTDEVSGRPSRVVPGSDGPVPSNKRPRAPSQERSVTSSKKTSKATAGGKVINISDDSASDSDISTIPPRDPKCAKAKSPEIDESDSEDMLSCKPVPGRPSNGIHKEPFSPDSPDPTVSQRFQMRKFKHQVLDKDKDKDKERMPPPRNTARPSSSTFDTPYKRVFSSSSRLPTDLFERIEAGILAPATSSAPIVPSATLHPKGTASDISTDDLSSSGTRRSGRRTVTIRHEGFVPTVEAIKELPSLKKAAPKKKTGPSQPYVSDED
ncbi:hypothetical protein MBLNU459_g3934t2 [Dothideomycetes sp. NU459]